MEAQEFTSLLNNPEKRLSLSTETMHQLAVDHPYSQAVQLLYALRLNKTNEHLFSRQLARTSILTGDRTLLYDLFEKENAVSITAEPRKSELVEKVIEKSEKIELEKEVEKEEEPIAEKPLVSEDVVERKVEIVAREESIISDEDLAKLPPAERIKAILERSRKIREAFEEKHVAQEKSEMDERIKNIREKLDAVRLTEKEVVEDKQPIVDVSEEAVKTSDNVVDEGVDTEIEEAIGAHIEAVQATEDEVYELEVNKDESVGEEEVELRDENIFIIDDEEEGSVVEENPVEVQEPEVDDINKNEKSTYSFSDWLKKVKDNAVIEQPKELEEEKPAPMNFDSKIGLLDSFMKKIPELKKKSRSLNPNYKSSYALQSPSNSDEDSGLVTETLAKVYINQGHFSKAIKAYQILKLKYPEKSGFFADRILEIKKLINSK